MSTVSNAALGGGIIVKDGDKSNRVQGFVPIDPVTGVPKGVPSVASATISTGNSLSSAIDLGGSRIVGLTVPAGWTAANVTFQVSTDGGVTYFNLYDKTGTEYTVVAAASRTFIIPVDDLKSIQFIKLRSGTSGTPVNQLTTDKIITLVLAS